MYFATLPTLLFVQPFLVTFLPSAYGLVIEHNKGVILPRAELAVEPVCQDGTLDSHDCNVALLSLGGGIQGAIQFLRVDDTTNTASSGSCTRMTVTAIDGGTVIDISKGRLEQAQKAAIDACGRQAWSVTALGGAVGGNLQIIQSSSSFAPSETTSDSSVAPKDEEATCSCARK